MKNIRLQYAAWEQLPPDFQSLFTRWMDTDPNHWDDEVAVNTLATAYWRERGET